MKFLKVVIFGLLFLLFPFCSVHAEDIQSFDAEYAIQKDGKVNVTEAITYDFGSLQKHGIFRTIPLIKKNTDNLSYRMSADSISVTDNFDKEYPYQNNSSQDQIYLKIGDPNRTISGVHIYKIKYTLSGALTYFSDHDEFYWNVTGNDWTVPIQNIQSTIILPEVIPASGITMKCFTGVIGSSDQNCKTQIGNSDYKFNSIHQLNTGEGITTIIGFPKSIVSQLDPVLVNTKAQKQVNIFTIVLYIIGFIFWYILLPAIMIIVWWIKGRDPRLTEGQPHVWFDIPKTLQLRALTPGETGTLIDERADMNDITATIVDLARRGYIKIIETSKNDFTFQKQKGTPEGKLEKHEEIFLSSLFTNTDSVKIKGTDFSSMVTKMQNALYDEVVNEKLFPSNPQSVRTKYIIFGFLAFITTNIPLAIVIFIFGWNMPKKTELGSKLAAVSRALKTFLVSQEAQLTFQAKNQLFFEKMLPYAIAFGVEKIWAARFRDIALANPSWYEGYHSSSMNSILFINSLNSSLQSFSYSATPTRSSSGFSSGFSGSSGGGGGGGGGGSW